MLRNLYLFALTLLVCFSGHSQSKKYSSSTILQDLKKLNVLGSVLYVAAHPDDENTAVIAYYANEALFRTGYLAATRGDGGQNLIGPEIREQLGIIRTQELLAARRVDGGRQFFSRANDFGYSKNPEETFNLWDKQEILSDFVWVFRKFRPDVIITRFDDQPPNHGHHTASAILAREAFKLSGDKNAFPEQLKHVDTWQPERIYWNTHPWFFMRRGVEFDTASYGKIPIGNYNPVLGTSYSEMSSISRTMHKSQGFGSTGSRGERDDYVTQWEGSESLQPFDGIDTSWGRVKGGEKVQPLVASLLSKFDPNDPSKILPELLKVKATIADNVKDDFWKKVKLKEVDNLILSITGTYLEIRANDFSFAPGDSIELSLEAVNRSSMPISLKSVKVLGLNNAIDQELEANQLVSKTWTTIISNREYSNPYWLAQKGELGRYKVEDQLLRGLPENPPVFTAEVVLGLERGNWLSKEYSGLKVELPVVYKTNDRVDGEVYRPVVIQPAVMANIESSSLIFSSTDPKEVSVRVIAGKDDTNGALKLEVPEGWSVSPSSVMIGLAEKNSESLHSFNITPPKNASEGVIRPVVVLVGEEGEFSLGRTIIEYDHIPTQTLFPKSETRVVKLDLKKRGEKVGYIMGAGDQIPESLEQIGYKVTLLEKDDVTVENLQKYQAVILGIRAFNTVDWLTYKNKDLFDYVKAGGNVIVQYNTVDVKTKELAPYDLTISRDRVTVEEAEVRFLDKKHPVLNTPNKITSADFEGWVQERGLYFPGKWSSEFSPIISSNDPGEEPLEGGLLVAKYGEGYYVYTGYSWFRELPAGVAGAYRVFANLISLGND